jgi:serine/threonine protein kinase
MTGQSIAHYKITAKLGEGGMGEVYRATDTKLNREVALKVLPESFAKDPDRMVRFQREAHVLAALNHPNIAAIYGLEDRALVMELVEGQPLAGPLPIDTALNYARQIADALEAAHEKGITHRDLKPANILVTPDGHVKVLDFGLAKAAESTQAPGDPDHSPTLTLAATRMGVIMGTAAYMAPEQARGQQVDKRADIWAFGVVLFEMLTGKRLFGGETVSDTLAWVLTKDLDLAALPADTPPPVRKLLHRCLQRDRKKRLRDIADARLELDEPAPPAQAPAQVRRSRLPWATATVALAAAGALGIGLWRSSRPAATPPMHLSVDLGSDTRLYPFGPNLALSPDGALLAYTSTADDESWRVYLRPLDQSQAKPLAGTESGGHLFFSPDGQWLAFFANRKLKKISIHGGAPINLADTTGDRGGSWGDDGRIVAALGIRAGLSLIPSSGGAPVPLTKTDPKNKQETHRWPQFLPGAKAVLFTSNLTSTFEDASVEVVSVESGQRKTLVRGGFFARYLPGGYLLYLSRNTLFAAPFDLDRLEMTSQPMPILEDVFVNQQEGAAYIGFSRTGTFLYHSGTPGGLNSTIHWLSPDGKSAPLLVKQAMFQHLRFSPEGKSLAVMVNDGAGEEVWVHDQPRDVFTRLSFQAGRKAGLTWNSRGNVILFGTAEGIWWLPSDGSSQPRRLIESGASYPCSISPDDKWLVYFQLNATGIDIYTLPLEWPSPGHPRAGKPEPFLNSPAVEVYPRISPDGRWLAYASNESGVAQVYVRPTPWTSQASTGKWQLSSDGGDLPVWDPAGGLLYYRFKDSLMAVPWSSSGSSFSAGKPRLWSESRLPPNAGRFWSFDMTPGGKRMALIMPFDSQAEQKPLNHLTFRLNFPEEIRRRRAAASPVQ